MSILYLDTLNNLVINSSNPLVEVFGLIGRGSCYLKTMIFQLCLFLYIYPFNSFSSLIALANVSRNILNKSGDNGDL